MVTLLKIGGMYINPDRKEFLIDSEADIAGLPTATSDGSSINGRCAPGSVAYTPDLKTIYLLGNDNTWHDASDGDV